jgi:hypothetical protein
MYLDTTTKSIDVIMGEAMTTSNPDYVVAYDDITTTTFSPIAGDGTLNGTSVVSIIPAPGSSTERHVKYLNINNVDTVSHIITVQLNDNSTNRVLVKYTLLSGESLSYIEGFGWQANQIDGTPKLGTVTALPVSLMFSYDKDIASVSNTYSLSGLSQQAIGLYIGTATKASSSVNILCRITTAIATITYSEFAIYKGSPTTNLTASQTVANGTISQNLTRLGFTDTSAIINSTGIFSVNISCSPSISVGDTIWFVQGHQATTMPIFRGAGIDSGGTPALNSLSYVSVASTRPSTSPTIQFVGTPSNYPWIAVYLN